MLLLKRRRPVQLLAGTAVTALLATGLVSAAAAAASPVTSIYAAPNGSGTRCSAAAPCSITTAQQTVRQARAGHTADARVILGDGTYRLAAPLDFDAADSGSPGHPVVWTAAHGAHPVLSGATRVGDWTASSPSGAWSTPVAATSASRQLYVDGTEAPVAQATPSQLHFAGGWKGSAQGYDLTADPAGLAFFSALTPAQLQQVEFDYPGGNGQWTDSKCRVQSLSGTSLTMDQPCWKDVTDRADYAQASGTLPSMGSSQMPASIQNARSLLHPGQWFLDQSSHTLYLYPLDGAEPDSLDVELPHLETLVQGAGSLARPVHDLTFSGLTFSYATWNAPSGPSGFADVQSNLHLTGANNQGMCSFSNPAGSCPWGLLTEPHANVSFTAADRITLTGNRFAELGGAGLGIAYGSSHNLVQGNEFTDIASTSVLLGCTADPTPVNPDPAHFPDYPTTNPDTPQVIKDNCTPDPSAVTGDTIGTNEIATYNTVSDNVIDHVGTDYPSASGITLLYSRHSLVTHNELYDLPYTGITAGVIQGHVDSADHPSNSLNINADNTISYNLIHDYLRVLGDGGGVYMEGHQAAYHYQADGRTIDFDATMAHGLQVIGNVTYDQGPGFASFYDDAGSEWIHYVGNVQFHNSGANAQGGCAPTGHFLVEGNYFSAPAGQYICANAVDSHVGSNTSIPAAPGPNDIQLTALQSAGPDPSGRGFAETTDLEADYVSTPQATFADGATTMRVLIAGAGFGPGTPVYFSGHAAPKVQVLSPGFLIASLPPGADTSQVSVGGLVAAPRISAPASGATGVAGTFTVHGSGVTGDTVTVTDGGTTLCRVTVAGSAWSCTATEADGQHTLVAVQSNPRGVDSPPAATVFVVGTAPASVRLNDTDPDIQYVGFSYQNNRGLGDYQDDLHYASDNGSTVTYTFVGTGIEVFGEQSGDEGHFSAALDAGTPVSVDTVPTDGQRHSNVVVWSKTGLPAGVHTLVLTKVDGTYMTFDGLEIDNS
ncbi:hypothetical protein ACEZCY_36770 [Streptacidiphilus sp. N1-12]|uniref:Right handed beta helix region n=2 Tax=Streptacidiphilus alkalitolerans TaxID=3342712 RepID=A0ABV6VLV1_9ACTN